MTEQSAPQKVQYGTLTPQDIGRIGVAAAKTQFAYMAVGDATKKTPNLHIRAAMDPDGLVGMIEVAQGVFGDGEQFAKYTSLDGGKLETVNEHAVDSGEAARELGIAYNNKAPSEVAHLFGSVSGVEPDKDDPRNWNGAAYEMGRVRINGVVHTKRFGMACSGVEGEVDRAVSKAGVAAMVAVWSLDTKARHGLTV